ncbi:MAG: helix-turn-helix domain-containing protein [Planctomycetales bacterium]|nr:helix-turn-helix domain-containing protein [Planctomycetales bacterium]
MSEILNEVRQLIENSGESRYSIWKATGIPQGQLCRLMQGQSGLSLDSLERLLQHLGHEIRITKRGG